MNCQIKDENSGPGSGKKVRIRIINTAGQPSHFLADIQEFYLLILKFLFEYLEEEWKFLLFVD
jgi:hypothetical protein